MCDDEYFDEKRQTYVMDSFEFSNGKCTKVTEVKTGHWYNNIKKLKR